MGWSEDKQKRKEHYLKYIYGWKLRDCTACNGSGWYDSCDKKGRPIECGGCEGTGKERYKPVLPPTDNIITLAIKELLESEEQNG